MQFTSKDMDTDTVRDTIILKNKNMLWQNFKKKKLYIRGNY